MSNRQLAIYESDPTDPEFGRLFGLNPGNTSGIPIPTMEFVATLPHAGGVAGQLYYVTVSHQSYVWDGTNFQPITPSVISSFDTDDALLKDTALKAGEYASATDTGNLYVKITSGWRQVGIHRYGTVAGLLGDTPADGSLGYAMDEHSLWLFEAGTWYCQSTRIFSDVTKLLGWSPTDGSTALAVDEGSLWVRSGGVWHCQTIRIMADFAAINLWNPPDGARAFDSATSLYYSRSGGAWHSTSPIVDTEVHIQALDTSTLHLGQTAIATDNGKSFVLFETGGVRHWLGSPIMHFPNQVSLLAAWAPNGSIGFADDTGLFYGRASGRWIRGNAGVQIHIATAALPHPTHPSPGDMSINTETPTSVEVFDGTDWKRVTPQMTAGDALPPNPIDGDIHQYSTDVAHPREMIYRDGEWRNKISIQIARSHTDISGPAPFIGLETDHPTLWVKSTQDGQPNSVKVDKLWNSAWGVIAYTDIIATNALPTSSTTRGPTACPCVAGRKYKVSASIAVGLKTYAGANKVHGHINFDGSWMHGGECGVAWNGQGMLDNVIVGTLCAAAIIDCTVSGSKRMYLNMSCTNSDAKCSDGWIMCEDIGPV